MFAFILSETRRMVSQNTTQIKSAADVTIALAA